MRAALVEQADMIHALFHFDMMWLILMR